MATSTAGTNAFLTDGGDTGALIRAHDWLDSPLGRVEFWPQSLRSIVGLMLGSKFPMFVAWGPELGFLYNDAYAAILGAKHPLALGKRFQDVWPEIWDDIFPIVAQALEGNPTFHENLPLTVYRRGRGEQAWFTFSYSPTRDESGNVAGMFCAVTETTSQILSERHRIAEYERMRRLFQQAPGLIAVLREPNHIFEIANDAFLQLVGQRDVVGKTVREALPELADQGFFELLDTVFRTGHPFIAHETLVRLQRRPDGPLEERYVSFVYQPTLDYLGEITGIFVEGSDVTEAVRAHRALRESEERLRQLANTIPQLAWIADAAGIVNWYNDRWYEYTGTTFGEMPGSGANGLFSADMHSAVEENWKASVANGQLFEMSFPLRSANGECRTFFSRAAPLRDGAGNIVQWFGTSTDVTPLENAKVELMEANRRKDEFLAMLAHELRNPLAPIATAAELLKLGGADQARLRKTGEVISRQVTHMTKLVDDLLDVSRVTRGLVTLRMEPLDIHGILLDAVEQTHAFIEAKCHRFSVLVPEVPFFVNGDRIRLIQVFSNLINNAAKYTPPRGSITVRVTGGEATVEVAVEDNGAGVVPSLQPHIFDLFTQAERTPDRAEGGLGLGLALVKSVVALHGGTVAMHSDGAGQGSVFTVSLPRENAPHSAPGHKGLKNEFVPAAKPLQVLIVDDNRDAGDTLSLFLQTLGHQVLVSYNPFDALALAQRNSPAVLFVDIGLPDMDGFELARRLRALPEMQRSLLVAVTGYGQAQDKVHAREAGFDHYLVKPVNLDQVVTLLGTVI